MFNPRSLESLGLWLPAHAITGLADAASVSAWADQSGNARNFAQGTAANQPTFRTSVLNGYPVVRFDGTNDVLAASSGLGLFRNVTGGTVFVVAKSAASPTVGRSLFIAYVGTSASLRLSVAEGNTSGKYTMLHRRLDADSAATGTSSAAVSLGWTVRSAVMEWGTDRKRLWVNGTNVIDVTGVNTGSTSDTNSNGIVIGANTSGTSPYSGDIAEILAWPRALSDEERKQVEFYLGRKYQIAVAT